MIAYEWTAEAVDEYGDIQDNAFGDTYAEVKNSLCAAVDEPGMTVRIGIVRNEWDDFDGDLEDRAWAYIEDGKLPERFETASGGKGPKVPKRFFAEIGS